MRESAHFLEIVAQRSPHCGMALLLDAGPRLRVWIGALEPACFDDASAPMLIPCPIGGAGGLNMVARASLLQNGTVS
jgi:predicted alpha/beta-hydrolase family hydrolase